MSHLTCVVVNERSIIFEFVSDMEELKWRIEASKMWNNLSTRTLIQLELQLREIQDPQSSCSTGSR